MNFTSAKRAVEAFQAIPYRQEGVLVAVKFLRSETEQAERAFDVLNCDTFVHRHVATKEAIAGLPVAGKLRGAERLLTLRSRK